MLTLLPRLPSYFKLPRLVPSRSPVAITRFLGEGRLDTRERQKSSLENNPITKSGNPALIKDAFNALESRQEDN